MQESPSEARGVGFEPSGYTWGIHLIEKVRRKPKSVR